MLRIIGNPNKEYYKDGSLFLNYLELGLDIMIGADYFVKKIIMHTNYPYHPHFGFYNKCCYELSIESNANLPEIFSSSIHKYEESKEHYEQSYSL